MVFQKRTCPCKLYEPAKRYSRNNRVSGSISQKSAFERNLHISGLLNEEKVDIGDTKVDIENGKVDIQDKKVDIDSVLSEKGSDFSVKVDIIEPVSGHGKGKYKFKK